MIRLFLILMMMLTAWVAKSAVMAYSVADDNFEFPDHLVQIDLETGEYSSMGQIADPFIAIEGLAIAPDGTLFGADDNTKTLIRITPQQADAFAVGNTNQNLGFGAVPDSYDFGMTFSCNSNLYMVVRHTNELYQVNETTGEASLIGNTGKNFTSIASWGDDLYALASGDFTLYKINKTTAETTSVGSLGDLGGDIELYGTGLSFDENGDLWMVVNLRLSDPLNPFPSRIFKINTETGLATLISETLVGIESLAIAPPGGCNTQGTLPIEAIPLNANWMLLLLSGLMLLLASLFIRKNSF